MWDRYRSSVWYPAQVSAFLSLFQQYSDAYSMLHFPRHLPFPLLFSASFCSSILQEGFAYRDDHIRLYYPERHKPQVLILKIGSFTSRTHTSRLFKGVSFSPIPSAKAHTPLLYCSSLLISSVTSDKLSSAVDKSSSI